MSETKINGSTEDKQLIKKDDYVQPAGPSTIAGVHGEFGADGQPQLPLLRIIQKVGKSSVEHPQDLGGLLYHKATIVPRPASISWYGLQGYYIQNLAFDPNGPKPQQFRTIAEVEASGGHCTAFIKPGVDETNYIPAAVAFLVIHTPNGPKIWARDCLEVSVPFEEKKTKELLLPAMWYLRSTQYRVVVPAIQRLAKEAEREGKQLCHAKYSLDTQQALVGSNYVYVPILKRMQEDNSNEFAGFLKDVFGE